MSYKKRRESIREELYSQIAFYKRGTKNQQKLANKMEEFANQIQCFQCLDTRESWYFREYAHRVDGQGDYYVMTCAICSTDNWIKNSLTNEIKGTLGIRLFNKENYSGAERFKALEDYVHEYYPELIVAEPTFNYVYKDVIKRKKKTTKINVEVGNIMNKCKDAFLSYCGDPTSLYSLLNSIKLSIENFDENNNQEKYMCQETKDKTFIFVTLWNQSKQEKKSILGLCEYDQYNLDIKLFYQVLIATNDSAYRQCQDIINKIGINDMEEVRNMFLSIPSSHDTVAA